MAIAEKLGYVSFNLANQVLESSMLNEATHEANNSSVHLFLLLSLGTVREDLHARLGQDRDYLADEEVSLIP